MRRKMHDLKPYWERSREGVYFANITSILMIMAFGWFFGIVMGYFIGGNV